MTLDTSKLTLFIFNRRTVPELVEAYNSAFRHWHKSWAEALSRVEPGYQLYSDNFERQDEVLGLFYEGRCIGLICHKYGDFSFEHTEKDSFFASWDQHSVQALKSAGPKVVIGTQISVDPEFRGLREPFSIKEMLISVSLYYLYQTPMDCVASMLRNAKGMDRLFYRFGAKKLSQTVFHGEPTDIISFFLKTSPIQIPQENLIFVSGLWKKKRGESLLSTKNNFKGVNTMDVKTLLQNHETSMRRLDELMLSCPWENREFYVNWCSQFYYFVAHATRLLSAAAARLGVDKDVFHVRFLDHCQEEKHHEKLFVKDLEALGERIDHLPELPLTSHLYQSQYFLVEHVNPLALFGGVLYFEGMSTSCGPEIYQRVSRAYGEKAANFVRVHVSEDTDHIEKATQALKALNSHELEAVWKSYNQMAAAYEHLLVDLKASVKNTSRPKGVDRSAAA